MMGLARNVARMEMNILWWEILKRRDHVGDSGAGSSMVLKWILKK